MTGEKMLQGLYSRDQTDWIIPPPIVDGKIPKNAYGNMDVYVPSMVPLGAIHLPNRGTKRICQRLGIDFAEAVTGFEFGARMAIPIITGVVVAEENEELVLGQWEKDEAERVRKEDEKRRAAALGKWRKFLMGLRVIERVREEYGDELDDNVDELNPWINKNSKRNKVDNEEKQIDNHRGEGTAGGFLLPSDDEKILTSSFFPTRHEDDDDGDEGGGGFIT
jgi:xeroderma pigmentosum group C-complementing protein